MHDQLMETFYLLSIAKLAQDWPELHPLRDRALEKLREIAKTPAHATPAIQQADPIRRPAMAPRFVENKNG